MNYLAHFHLARANDAWIVGALLGDFIKGPLTGAWPRGWENGMRLHRRIDAFSDQHPLRLHFARNLPVEYRRYAGIVLDVYCDHLLSLHWQRFHDEPLPQFAARVYALLEKQLSAQNGVQLPASAARMARRLIDYDVLCIYHRWNTVAGSLARIGERFARANPLARAGVELLPYVACAEEVFLEFYPQLLAHCAHVSVEL